MLQDEEEVEEEEEEKEAGRGVGDADLEGKHVERGGSGEFGATRVHILKSQRYIGTLIGKSIRTLTFENFFFWPGYSHSVSYLGVFGELSIIRVSSSCVSSCVFFARLPSLLDGRFVVV